MNKINELTSALGIKYPIIQAPMLGVTSPEMVAAIANAGGLGSLPVGGLSPERTRDVITKTKTLTDRPFAVNLFIQHDFPTVDITPAEAMQQLLAQLAAERGLSFEQAPIDTMSFYSYKEQIPVLLNEGIGIVSFTFGIPGDASISKLQEHGVILMGTATCVQEAMMLREKNIPYIVAQGIEAGGHRGTFFSDEPLPQVGVLPLVSMIVAQVDTPVIAAGGIHDQRTIRAAMELGAAAVQPGTAFIASHESLAIPAYKAALAHDTDTSSVLTRAYSGRWARGIRNKMMTTIENSGIPVQGYPIQNSLTTPLRAAAQRANDKELTNLWAGQCCGKAEMLPAREIFEKMVGAE